MTDTSGSDDPSAARHDPGQLADELHRSDPRRVLTAARALCESADPCAWEALVAADLTGRPALKREVRTLADQAFAKLVDHRGIASVSSEAVLVMIRRFQTARGDEGLAVLRSALAHRDPQVGRKACSALEARRVPPATDEERRLRAFVSRDMDLLRRLGPETACDLLATKLRAYDPEDRRFAATGLGELRDVRAVDPLLDALTDGTEVVREAAAAALAQLGSRRDVEPPGAPPGGLKVAEDAVRRKAADIQAAPGDARAREDYRAALDAVMNLHLPGKRTYYVALADDRGGWRDREGVGFNFRMWENATRRMEPGERDRLASHPEGRYELAPAWELGKPMEEDRHHSSGFALWKTPEDALRDAPFPFVLFEAQPCGGLLAEDERKAQFASARIVRRAGGLEWLEGAARFVGSISKIRFLSGPAREALGSWRLFESAADAAAAAGSDWRQVEREEAWRDAKAAAQERAIALDLAAREARVAAMRAVGRVGNALSDRLELLHPGHTNLHREDPEKDVEHVRHPIVERARSAGLSAEFAAGEDASLSAAILVCAGLELDPRHGRHAAERWQVWERGFGLTACVNGVLYVYRELIGSGDRS